MKKFTTGVRKDCALGEEILNRPWTELNDRSIVDDENRGQMMFNAFVDTSVEDPAEAWKWRGTRSMARNKGIAMHANLTANYLLPLFSAQNEDDETDQDLSEAMRDIVEWMAAPSNSNYQTSFLEIVFGSIKNPVTYLGAEYNEVYQTIKEKSSSGKYTTKEILDEVLSGFNAPVWSSTQVLITNAFERNLQRQRRIIKRRFVEKDELEAKYGHLDNWAYVQAGIKTLYNDEDGLFYDVKDDSHSNPNIVAEETAYNRREDSQVCFVNGIPMVDGNIEDSPIQHRDNRNAPKYDIVPFGYLRIGEHFFYYKSMMNALGWDNALYDAQTEVFMNRAFLEAEMPVAISGSDEIDSEVVFPGSVVTMEDPNSKATSLLPQGNLGALASAMAMTEKSINDGSLNETSSGQLPSGSNTAYAISQAQAAAKKIIGSAAKSVAESVVKYGDLMKDIAINNVTAPQAEELLSGNLALRYRTFLVDSKGGTGDYSSKTVKFDKSLIGIELTPEELKMREVELAEKSGYPEKGKSMRLANPERFANFRYLTRVDYEEMFPKNQEYWQPVLLNLKTALMQDPTIDQAGLSRKLMRSYFRSGGDDLVMKTPVAPVAGTGVPGANELGGVVNSKAVAGVATEAVQ